MNRFNVRSFLILDALISTVYFCLVILFGGFLCWPGASMANALNVSVGSIFWWCIMILNSLVWGAVLTLFVFLLFCVTVVRQYWDFVSYTFRVLWDWKKKFWFIISLIILIFGALSLRLPSEHTFHASISVFIVLTSVSGLIISLWDLLKGIFSSPEIMSVELDETRNRIQKGNVRNGYEIVEIQHRVAHSEDMMYSKAVNEWLQSGGKIFFDIDEQRCTNLIRRIRNDVPDARSFLLWNIRHKRSLFFNESKVGIGSDIDPEWICNNSNEAMHLRIYKTSYFSSFLTVECQRKKMMRANHSNNGMHAIVNELPSFVDADGRLVDLSCDGLSLHIGVTVLAVTSDNKICIWLQSKESEINSGTVVASGSGSLDWDDLDMNSRDLTDALIAGAQRELKEECGLADDSVIVETRILGYARWCERGGKPEFFFLTKLNVERSRLKNNRKEVLQYSELTNRPAIKNINDLVSEINRLLHNTSILLSTPLKTLLIFLNMLLKHKPEYVDFLLRDALQA